ncbi:MAG: hypothetical protein JOZ59_02460 [Candidatus Eremiobacteraeota bacterium]|nr:hypothetical protein [Candidatus Eremiobacteraeota bacterium]
MSEPAPRQLHVHSVPTRAERWRTIVEIAAIVVAGLWALYVFVYEQRIKPLSEKPSFAVPTDIQQSRAVNGVIFLTIHKRLINTGNVPIDIAAETLSVYGEIVGKQPAKTIVANTSSYGELRWDVPRHVSKLLFSFVDLRSGAQGGDPNRDFWVPPHSSNEETFLVAVPSRLYPAILVTRKDYIKKAPIEPPIPMRVTRNHFQAYGLQSPDRVGEYDSDMEYPLAR